jgi:hypothetical protein
MTKKKFNPIAGAIIFLSIILVLIFADKILVNLSAAFLIVGLPVYYYFINNPQQSIGLLIFFPTLFYLNHASNVFGKALDDEYKNQYPAFEAEGRVGELDAWYQTIKSDNAQKNLHSYFLLLALTVPASFFISILFGLKQFSLAVMSGDLLFPAGWLLEWL